MSTKRKTNMKSCKLLVAMLVLIGTTACTRSEAEIYWQETVVKRLKGQKYVSLRAELEEYSLLEGQEFDRIPTKTIDIHLTPQGLYLRDNFRYKLLAKDSLFIYHYKEGNFTYGRHTLQETDFEKNVFKYLLDGWVRDIDELIPFYLFPEKSSSYKLDLFDMKYAGIEPEGDSVHVLRIESRWPWKEKAKDGSSISKKTTIELWVEDASGLVSRVRRTVHCSNSSWGSEIDEVSDLRISCISLEETHFDTRPYRVGLGNDSTIDCYNINSGNVSPSDFSIHVPEEDADLDSFLDTPLINAAHDTVTLRQVEGWVLVEYWMFGCKGCQQFIQMMQQEQETLGYRKLEHEGIAIMCINPQSSVTEYFREYVKKFGIEDIAYSAKDIGNTMNYKNMPYYFLLTPDKKIVYRGNNLGEKYEKVVDAKKKYIKK